MTDNISFIEALSILSKSSPFAVSTENHEHSKALLNEIKEYLYVQMPIEELVYSTISKLSSRNKKIVFLYSLIDGQRCVFMINGMIA